MEAIVEKIEEFIQDGLDVLDPSSYNNWSSRVYAFLKTAIDEKTAENFTSSVGDGLYSWKQCLDTQIGHLEGLALRLKSKDIQIKSNDIQSVTKEPVVTISQEPVVLKTKKVFVVHGHDSETKESVARFIEKLGLDPIILHEKPNSGRTIIEKFEVYSDVGYAVVLLTPDDVGASGDEKDKLKGRARQNVILELGYFMGKLGRRRVCALYKGGVEIPSDYQGVLYTEIDDTIEWKVKIAQELSNAGFKINVEALLQG